MSETNLCLVGQHIYKRLRLHKPDAPEPEITNLANNIAFLVHAKVPAKVQLESIFVVKIFIPGNVIVPLAGRYRMEVVYQIAAKCVVVVGVMDEITAQERHVVWSELGLYTLLVAEVAREVEKVLDGSSSGERPDNV